MTIQKKPVCLSLWNDKFAEFNLHQHFGLDRTSELCWLKCLPVQSNRHGHLTYQLNSRGKRKRGYRLLTREFIMVRWGQLLACPRCTVDYGVANATSLYHGGGPLRWLYCDKEDLGNTAVTGFNCLFADIVRLIRSWGSSTFPGSFSVWQNKI